MNKEKNPERLAIFKFFLYFLDDFCFKQKFIVLLLFLATHRFVYVSMELFPFISFFTILAIIALNETVIVYSEYKS